MLINLKNCGFKNTYLTSCVKGNVVLKDNFTSNIKI